MSPYLPFFNVNDPVVRNTAILLDTANDAVEAGEITLEEFHLIAVDLLEAADTMPEDNHEGSLQLSELQAIALAETRG